VSVTELNEIIGNDVIPTSDDYETVAGLVIFKAGDIPKEGYSFKLNDYKITVKEVLKKRIKRIELDKIDKN
jgi:CBS domain containing-hemolysin-like protein